MAESAGTTVDAVGGPRPPVVGTPPVRVTNLSKRYGDTVAVDDLTFSIHPGLVTGFLGPNGSGKTTTFRMVLGLATPTQGTAEIFGRPYAELEDPLRRVGVLIDCSGFHPARSARDNLRIQAAAAGIPNGRIDEVLELVELTAAADRRVGGFSTGMERRLGLAAALLGEPDLLLLDEPANGLDPAGTKWLREFLRGFARSGGTVIVSSHVLAEMAQVADEVIIIRKGAFVARGALDDLVGSSSVDVVHVQSPSRAALAELLRARGAEVTEEMDPTERAPHGKLVVAGMTGAEIGELAASAGFALHELTPESSTLEDTFLALTSGAEGAA